MDSGRANARRCGLGWLKHDAANRDALPHITGPFYPEQPCHRETLNWDPFYIRLHRTFAATPSAHQYNIVRSSLAGASTQEKVQ
jgi:hypothetical protein